jgi:hypothetical protein
MENSPAIKETLCKMDIANIHCECYSI